MSVTDTPNCSASPAHTPATVFVSIYLMLNAALIGEARALGEVTYLSEGEIGLTEQMNFRARSQNRAWEYWARRAGFTTTVND